MPRGTIRFHGGEGTVTHHRDSLFISPPPPGMENPIGRWYCDECDCLATECEAKGSHVWKVKWMEDKNE